MLPVAASDPCPDCLIAYAALPDVSTMTVEQRIAELRSWYGPLEIEFGDLHRRIEQLVGGPVFTHMLIEREYLEERIRNG
jgi:hypothetical protein